MLIETEIYLDYNPFDSSYENSKWELVEVPTECVAHAICKRFGITAQQMYSILTEFEDYMDFSEYFSEDLEVQNLAREFYNPEEEE